MRTAAAPAKTVYLSTAGVLKRATAWAIAPSDRNIKTS
jgi:hypothetical protein